MKLPKTSKALCLFCLSGLAAVFFLYNQKEKISSPDTVPQYLGEEIVKCKYSSRKSQNGFDVYIEENQTRQSNIKYKAICERFSDNLENGFQVKLNILNINRSELLTKLRRCAEGKDLNLMESLSYRDLLEEYFKSKNCSSVYNFEDIHRVILGRNKDVSVDIGPNEIEFFRETLGGSDPYADVYLIFRDQKSVNLYCLINSSDRKEYISENELVNICLTKIM